MEKVIDFLSFQDPTVRLVVAGTVLLSISAAVVGCFAYLRKRALVGDALAHSLLPGVAMAFLFSGQKDPWLLLLGAMVSGWLALGAMELIQQHTKLASETAIALVLSVFFGFGVLMLTYLQHHGGGDQAGLDQFLFGNAASMRSSDLYAYGLVGIVLLVIIGAFYKELKLYCFDPDHAQAIGLPTRVLRYMLNTMTVLATAIGIQSVGVVLMAALLITPAATARFWSYRLRTMLFLAALGGAVAGLGGSFASYLAPAMPTGPWIVMVLSFLALVSIFLAPRVGIFARMWRQRQNRRKIIRENLLKAFYHGLENREADQAWLSRPEWQEQRHLPEWEWQIGFRQLRRHRWILRRSGHYRLTERGLAEARRVVRLHRLWELYLSRYLALGKDHLHPGAESIEHLITPEVEKELLRELDYPEQDPHRSPIPYKS
jgi:manganese/zinc/iron transport system permease protein